MQAAAANEGAGAMGAFVGMGMAGNAAGGNLQNLYQMGQAQPQQAAAQAAPSGQAQAGGSAWTCSCGTVNQGNFCGNCGAKRPEAEWTCSCGAVNKGNFCGNCGNKRP